MANPFSPRSETSLNAQRPAFSVEDSKALGAPSEDQTHNALDDLTFTTKLPSSPFIPDIGQENQAPQDTSSPRKQWSPVKVVSSPKLPFKIHEDQHIEETARSSATSPNKPLGPSGAYEVSKFTDASPQRQLLIESGAKIAEKTSHVVQDIGMEDPADDNRSIVSDDTCFTAFSAVPNADMTLFAALGQRKADSTLRSPTRETSNCRTPRAKVFSTPATSRRHDTELRSSSPTPRGQAKSSGEGNNTSLLLDFTQDFESFSKPTGASPTRRGASPTKSQTEPSLLNFINGRRNPSPSKAKNTTPGGRHNMLNLLDFDLPPQPTPRSIPTITVREMESLKSAHLSEISSMKATLSGREAEVESLKKAVSDAERRVGEALEIVREERAAREHAVQEKTAWEKKGKEVETVLKSVREEFVNADREREELLAQLEDSNRRTEEAELRLAEFASKSAVSQGSTTGSEVGTPAESAELERLVAKQLDEKMENLARELHAVYKKKHETKVATLKKTYEARSEKKLTELHQKVEELTKQNEELQAAKDATLSGTIPSSIASIGAEGQEQLERQKTELEEQKAKIAGLMEEMNTVKRSHSQILIDLECERVEKGELVAAVDEMLALQSEIGAPSAIEDFRKSICRPPSGLKTPSIGGGDSKIGRMQQPGSFKGSSIGKSRMMSNIERMGSGFKEQSY